ncbi:MAG: hypothetical protein AB8F34_06605 [Akkermansiaceae bacterium]
MNDNYKKSVTLFGIALPCLLMAIVVGVVLYMSSSISTEYTKKKKAYDKAQVGLKQTMELQGKVQETSQYLREWDHLLNTETRGTFVEHLKTAEEKFSGKELTKTNHNWVNYSSGLGKGITQPASQLNMSFSATYRAMQLALLELETKLPHMQLDSLTMTPEKNGETINFKTTHTIWTLK